MRTRATAWFELDYEPIGTLLGFIKLLFHVDSEFESSGVCVCANGRERVVKLDHVMRRLKSVKLNAFSMDCFRTPALSPLSLIVRGAYIVHVYSRENSSTTTHASASPRYLPQTETPLNPVKVVKFKARADGSLAHEQCVFSHHASSPHVCCLLQLCILQLTSCPLIARFPCTL